MGVAAGDPRRKTGERRVYRVATRHRREYESEEERACVKDTWRRERNRDWLNRSRKSPPGCSTGRHFAQFSTALRVKRSFRDISSLSLSLSAIRAGSTLRSRSRASARSHSPGNRERTRQRYPNLATFERGPGKGQTKGLKKTTMCERKLLRVL